MVDCDGGLWIVMVDVILLFFMAIRQLVTRQHNSLFSMTVKIVKHVYDDWSNYENEASASRVKPCLSINHFTCRHNIITNQSKYKMGQDALP